MQNFKKNLRFWKATLNARKHTEVLKNDSEQKFIKINKDHLPSVVPQYLGYLEDQTNVLEEEEYKTRIMEIMHYEILFDRSKLKSGKN